MAGDKRLYDKAISAGLNFAWEGKWDQALVAYKRALEEMPSDPVVYNHLGLAYYELEQFEPALDSYAKAYSLDSKQVAPLVRISEIHEQLGQRHAAADSYYALAEKHREQRDWAQAIHALQRGTKLNPDHIGSLVALADILIEVDQPQRAAKAYLDLARAYRRQGQFDEALTQCRKVLDLDPKNAEARALGESLRAGSPVDDVGSGLSPEDEGSPIHMARDKALEELAGIPFEDAPAGPVPDMAGFRLDADSDNPLVKAALSRPQIDSLIAQAIDFQTRALVDEAIATYIKVIEAGVDRPAAHFNLGLLYQQRLRFEPAIAEFKKVVEQPNYALGGHYALGECYRALGNVDEALEHFVEALKIVDLGTVKREQADDLIELYDALAESFAVKGDHEKAIDFTNSLVEFLSSRGWEDKARAARQRIDGLADVGVTMSLAEVIAAPNAERVLSAVTLSQEYLKRGALTAATEVCYEAIQTAPMYLPLHMRLAEIFVQDGRIDDAVNKYQMVAEVYLVRGEARAAIGAYEEVLGLVPMDVPVRSRLIDLLISSGEIDQALEQYLALADAYFQVAQINRALEKYAEAIRLAPRASDEQAWQLRLLRKMADVQMRRGSWQDAVGVYQRIVGLAPEDERAWLNLIDLCYKIGRPKQADKEVVSMLANHRERGESERALALLQEAVRLQPQQMALRARLARAYIDAGNRSDAIRELDALGELQLDAGLRDQAVTTVRFIISLKPENVDAYRELLAQL